MRATYLLFESFCKFKVRRPRQYSHGLRLADEVCRLLQWVLDTQRAWNRTQGEYCDDGNCKFISAKGQDVNVNLFPAPDVLHSIRTQASLDNSTVDENITKKL